MKTLNLQIFSENEDFYRDLDRFMCDRSKEYEIIKKRISSLNQILDKEESRDLKVEYFLGDGLEGKFKFDTLYGEIYDLNKLEHVSLSKASHVIKSIDIDYSRFKFVAEVIILNTNQGSVLQNYPEEFFRIRPVYYYTQPDRILTFNIELITINETA